MLFSNAIYANEDADILPIKEQFQDNSLCLVAAKEASKKFGVSYDLLQTISAVESGVWNNIRNTYVAWPWTVNVNGKGYYYETKADAVSAIKKFQADGFQSIDVGCMQINLKYHGSAFSSVEEALDPSQNVQYSAKFLRTLYSRFDNDWEKAAKRYHSAKPIEGTVYSKRLQNRFESYKLAGLAQNLQLF